MEENAHPRRDLEYFQERTLRPFPPLLARFRGGYARLWDMTVGHAQLSIRVHKDGERQSLHIICEGPVHICAPHHWHDSEIEVTAFNDESEPDARYQVIDSRHDVRITCSRVSTRLSEEPIFVP